MSEAAHMTNRDRSEDQRYPRYRRLFPQRAADL